MVEALRNLRREIDALASAFRARRLAYVTERALLERVRQLFLSWSSFRVLISGFNVAPEVVDRVDRLFTELARLAARRNRGRDYLRSLAAIRSALTGQLLLEIARVAEVSRAAPGPTLRESLIPEIPDVTTELIPNALLGWKDSMRRFLKGSAFDHNVFIMVAYRRRMNALIQRIRAALEEIGLNAVVARDHRITDDLYNPIACLLCCRYGVAIFDRGEADQAHNANIVYELAIMQLLKRPCVILKHTSLRTMPSDFLARLYEDYRTANEAVEKVRRWWEAVSRESS